MFNKAVLKKKQQKKNNEFLGNALITSGWLKPLTILNRDHWMQTLIVQDVLKKMATATGWIPYKTRGTGNSWHLRPEYLASGFDKSGSTWMPGVPRRKQWEGGQLFPC